MKFFCKTKKNILFDFMIYWYTIQLNAYISYSYNMIRDVEIISKVSTNYHVKLIQKSKIVLNANT